jgi:hypothetical protein
MYTPSFSFHFTQPNAVSLACGMQSDIGPIVLGTTSCQNILNKVFFGSSSAVFPIYKMLFDTEERQFRLLCQRYWGKGENGRAEIYKVETEFVPYMVRAI